MHKDSDSMASQSLNSSDNMMRSESLHNDSFLLLKVNKFNKMNLYPCLYQIPKKCFVGQTIRCLRVACPTPPTRWVSLSPVEVNSSK